MTMRAEFEKWAGRTEWYTPDQVGHADALRHLAELRQRDPALFDRLVQEWDNRQSEAWQIAIGGRPVKHPPLRELLAPLLAP
jgi:hypothetical protein